MQSWFSFELDGEACRVEKEDTHGTLAAFLSRIDPCFAYFADQGHDRTPRLVVLGVLEGERHRFRAVDAASIMLPMIADRQIWTPEGIRNAEPVHPVNLAYQNGQFECGAERLDSLVALTFEGYYRPDLRRRGQINDQFDAITTRTANIPAIREAATQVFASTEQLRHETALRAERSGQESAVWTGRKDIFGDRFTKQLFRLGERKSLHYVDGSKRRFFRPETLVELLKLKREYADAILVAGGSGLNRTAGNIEFPNLLSLEAAKELNSIYAGRVSCLRLAARSACAAPHGPERPRPPPFRRGRTGCAGIAILRRTRPDDPPAERADSQHHHPPRERDDPLVARSDFAIVRRLHGLAEPHELDGLRIGSLCGRTAGQTDRKSVARLFWNRRGPGPHPRSRRFPGRRKRSAKCYRF